MELRQLEYVVAVAEERAFNRAAARIPIAQSALSKAIRRLERELGSPLFARTTRRVELTEAGELFLVEARRTLAAADAARAAVGDVRDLLRGTLAVGGFAAVGRFDQAGALAQFRRRHPQVRVRYVRDTSTRLIDDVRSGRLDAAFVGLPGPPAEGTRAIEVRTEPVWFVCHPDHPLAGRSSVEPGDLVGEDFIGAPDGTVGRTVIERLFAAAGVPPAVAFEANDTAVILEFVARGAGVTVVTDSYARHHAHLPASPVVGVTATWTVALVSGDGESASPAARAFLHLVDDLLDDEGAPRDRQGADPRPAPA